MAFRLLIVNYHYIREDKPVAGIYPITPKEFKDQLITLSRQYSFCSQQDVLNWVFTTDLPNQSYCLITFDDGLAEQITAFEILKSMGIPGVFFVPVQPYLSGKVLTVHKLHHIRSVLSDEDLYNKIKLLADVEKFPFDQNLLDTQYRYDTPLAQRIKYYLNFGISLADADHLVDSIFRLLVTDERVFASNLYMSEQHLKLMADSNALGSHGTDHKPLATLSVEQVEHDVIRSISFLEKIAGQSIFSFAYPYGSRAAVNDETATILGRTPIRLGFTMFRGINGPLQMKNPYLLHRVDTHDAPGGKNPLREFSE